MYRALTSSPLPHSLRSCRPATASFREALSSSRVEIRSFSLWPFDSGFRSRLTEAAAWTCGVLVLWAARKESFHSPRFGDLDEKRDSSSGVIISETFAGSGSEGLSMAVLNRNICECNVGLEESMEWAAIKHFKARTYFSVNMNVSETTIKY